MKTLLTTLLLLITVNANAQFSNGVVQSYVNEVYENVQGHVEEYGIKDTSEYSIGYASEYMDFSLVRTMIGIIATSNRNIELAQTWINTGKGQYRYAVVIDKKYIVLIMYRDSDKMISIIKSDLN